MKVLTLREPWASLIGKQIKTIETRSWKTCYRGELYIHAGLTKIPKKNERINRLIAYLGNDTLHYGEIFVKCTLENCILIDEKFVEREKERNSINFDCGDYALGRYAWILGNVEYVEPIKAKGRLGIWNYN